MNAPAYLHSSYQPEFIKLDSGVNLVIDRVPSVESCALGFWIDVGTRDEPRGQAGVAHFVEHTAFRRTRSMGNQKIARSFENVGAFANAFTTKEETCFYVRTLSKHLDTVFNTLAEVVLHPTFANGDIAKERTIITEEIRSYEDDPEELVFDIGEQQLFGRHPLGMPILGSIDSVEHITAEQVRQFHASNYTTDNIHVCVSGNVDAHHVRSLVERTFADVPRTRRLRKRRSTPARTAPFQYTVSRPVQQAHTLWQFPTGGYDTADKYALMLLNVILGDGMSSRLNVRLREQRGLAYTIYSQMQFFRDVGTLAIYAGVDEKNLNRTWAMLTSELAAFNTRPVSKSELQRAKEQLRSAKIMSLESLSARMNMIGKGLLEEGAPENPFETIAAIDAVTVHDVMATASAISDADLWSSCTLIPGDD